MLIDSSVLDKLFITPFVCLIHVEKQMVVNTAIQWNYFYFLLIRNEVSTKNTSPHFQAIVQHSICQQPFDISDFREINKLRRLGQVRWKILSITAAGVTSLKKKVIMSRMCHCLMCLSKMMGALNSLPEQTLLWELTRGHITSCGEKLGPLNLMGYPDLHTSAIHLPLSISTVYFSILVPGFPSRDLTFTFSHKELQGVCEVFQHWLWILLL